MFEEIMRSATALLRGEGLLPEEADGSGSGSWPGSVGAWTSIRSTRRSTT